MAKTRRSNRNRLHRVTLCRYAPEGRRAAGQRSGGGRRKLWAFSYNDLAAWLKLKPDTVRRVIRAQGFDPRDLASIGAYWLSRLPREELGTQLPPAVQLVRGLTRRIALGTDA